LNSNRREFLAKSLLTLGAAAGGALVARTVAQPAATAPAGAPATAPATMAVANRKGSAQLWQETCSRCHNLRSPSAYSADQWQVIVHDMRIRAQLTGQDQRQVLEFLKSAQ
jgi:cytochrome c5